MKFFCTAEPKGKDNFAAFLKNSFCKLHTNIFLKAGLSLQNQFWRLNHDCTFTALGTAIMVSSVWLSTDLDRNWLQTGVSFLSSKQKYKHCLYLLNLLKFQCRIVCKCCLQMIKVIMMFTI